MWMATSFFFFFGGGLQQEGRFQISNQSFISWDDWTFLIIFLFGSKLLVFISLLLKFTFYLIFYQLNKTKLGFIFS